MPGPSSPDPAFRRLQRTLVRRRLAALDLRLRVELALIALLIGGFLFWQARIPLDALVRARGPLAVVPPLLGLAVLLALAGGSLAAACHYRHLRHAPPGPDWLALPVPAARVGRHLAWEARLHALWMAIPLPFLLLAAAGLVPAWWLAIVEAAGVWMLLEAGRLGCAVAWRLAVRKAEARPFHPMIRLLSNRAVAAPAPARRPPAPWRRVRAWRALWDKDRLLGRRSPAVRRRLAAPLAFGVLSIVCWGLVVPTIARPLSTQLGSPVTLGMAHVLAFGLALLTAFTLGEWLIALSGEDPFAVLRHLPIGVGTVWSARMIQVVIAVVALSAGHAIAAPLAPRALAFFLVWNAAAALAIGTLAVNYGVTLFPHQDAAQRMYALSLGLAIASSLMIPLMGWIVLLTAVIHSARRLPRWATLEPAS